VLDFMSQWIKEEADFRFRMSILDLKLPLLGNLGSNLGRTILYSMNFVREDGFNAKKHLCLEHTSVIIYSLAWSDPQNTVPLLEGRIP